MKLQHPVAKRTNTPCPYTALSRCVAEGLRPGAWLSAGAAELIRDAPPAARVTAMRHCGDSYFISTGDGRETPYWEKNIRLKIDSVETGPPPGVPVILQAGMGGDRFSVVFSSLTDITRSEEHTSELQSLMRISYAVFCLQKKQHTQKNTRTQN